MRTFTRDTGEPRPSVSGANFRRRFLKCFVTEILVGKGSYACPRNEGRHYPRYKVCLVGSLVVRHTAAALRHVDRPANC